MTIPTVRLNIAASARYSFPHRPVNLLSVCKHARTYVFALHIVVRVKTDDMFVRTLTFVAVLLIVDSRQNSPEPCERSTDREGKTVVSCVNRNLTTDLPPVDGAHEVRLSYNDFPTLNARLLSPISNVKVLKLDHCGVRTIDDGAFRGLASLYKLDCSHNRIAELARATFVGLERLTTIDLQHNELVRIEDDVFARLKRLEYVELSFNRIESIGTNGFGDKVRTIVVRDNRLTYLDVLENVPYGTNVYAIDNPLICDCRLKRFLVWARGHNVNAKCARPHEYANKELSAVDEETLACRLLEKNVTCCFVDDEYERANVSCGVYSSFPHASLRFEWTVVPASKSSQISLLGNVTERATALTTYVLAGNISGIDRVECIFSVDGVNRSAGLHVSNVKNVLCPRASVVRRNTTDRTDVDDSSILVRDETLNASDVAPVVAIVCSVAVLGSAFACATVYAVRRKRTRRGAVTTVSNDKDEINSLYGVNVD